MMNRRTPDMDNPGHSRSNYQEQQQQQQQGQQFMRTRTSMGMQQPGFSTGGASAAFPDISSELRRYSLSVAPGSTGMSTSEQQQQMLQRHQQQQQQQYMMQQLQHQSGSAAGDSNFRQDVNQAMMSAAGGVNFPMSGDMSIAQRMQGMGQMFGIMGSGGSANFGQVGSQRGPNAPGGDSISDSRASFSGTTAGSQSAGGISQADREEELLLNLLIARRQRGQMTGDGHAQSQALADELMRLRQNRAAAAAAAAAMGSTGTGGGALGSVPGMSSTLGMFPESIYQQQFPQASSVSQLGGGTSVGPSGMFLDYQQLAAARSSTDPNISATQEINERIDRSPNRMMDARSQEMLELSGRGVRRGFNIDMSGMLGTQGMYGGVVISDAMAPPKKKAKRAHKKKPADMPRRPLSAYNLFFSEERERILKEIEAKESGESKDKEDEETPKTEEGESEEKATEESEEKKPKALLRPLIPSQKKRRPHRKTHGKISFQQLARMVGERWKALDTDRRKYYQDLANEDMKRQKAAMEAYYAKQNEGKGSDEKVAVDEAAPKDSGDKVKEEEVTTEV